jgi:hypothetical protein
MVEALAFHDRELGLHDSTFRLPECDIAFREHNFLSIAQQHRVHRT